VKADDKGGLEGLALRVPLDGPAPPAGAALLGALGAMKPVRTRARLGAFLVVGGLGLVLPALTLARAPLRPDLSALPPAWVALGAALWALAFVPSLAAVLVPRAGDVLPSVGRAARGAVVAMGVLVVFFAAWTASVPGVSVRPEDLGVTTLQSSRGCATFVLEVAAPFLALGFLALRRVLPMGGRAAGIALGAAGGAAGGLALHFHCPVATTGHVLIGHVGAMIAASAAGAWLLGVLLDR
jgi:hypothetical protein